MKTIYLIRHGQTEANLSARCQGPDEPLSAAGLIQADRVAERVKNLKFDKIISSDYLRTRQTAEAILKLSDVPLETSQFFREEIWPSRFVENEMLETKGDTVDYITGLVDHADDKSWRYEDGENTSDIVNRIKQGLKLLEDEASQDIVVVSHGNFLKQLFGYVFLQGKGSLGDVAAFKLSMKTTNTGINVLEHTGEQWRVLTWNDHAHFTE